MNVEGYGAKSHKGASMRRLTLALVLTALCMAGMASPLAAAAANDGRCVAEAARAGLMGRDANPHSFNVVTGTEDDDVFSSSHFTAAADLICGFGGNDLVSFDIALEAPDMFIGDEGGDASRLAGGTFIGGEGFDTVSVMTGGIFIGDEGHDAVHFMFGGAFIGGAGIDDVSALQGGTFDGNDGDDTVLTMATFFGLPSTGTFNGGAGNDVVSVMGSGTFNGNEGDDTVNTMFGGTFNGGPGSDVVLSQGGGTFNQD